MRFLIDAQLPPALANWLEDQGHHAEHVAALGLEGAEDPDIWVKARALDAILITKDEDFVVIRERAAGGPLPGLLGIEHIVGWSGNCCCLAGCGP